MHICCDFLNHGVATATEAIGARHADANPLKIFLAVVLGEATTLKAWLSVIPVGPRIYAWVAWMPATWLRLVPGGVGTGIGRSLYKPGNGLRSSGKRLWRWRKRISPDLQDRCRAIDNALVEGRRRFEETNQSTIEKASNGSVTLVEHRGMRSVTRPTTRGALRPQYLSQPPFGPAHAVFPNGRFVAVCVNATGKSHRLQSLQSRDWKTEGRFKAELSHSRSTA